MPYLEEDPTRSGKLFASSLILYFQDIYCNILNKHMLEFLNKILETTDF